VYQDPLHLYKYTTNNCLHFKSLKFLHFSTLAKVALILFPDDDPLGIETCRNVQYDNVI
jgi:hypothetical protein